MGRNHKKKCASSTSSSSSSSTWSSWSSSSTKTCKKSKKSCVKPCNTCPTYGGCGECVTCVGNGCGRGSGVWAWNAFWSGYPVVPAYAGGCSCCNTGNACGRPPCAVNNGYRYYW